MSSPLQVFICGARGRMGQTLLDIASTENAQVAGAIDQGDDIDISLSKSGAAVAIDFSFHSATPELARCCAAAGTALVIGTTGHTAQERAAILEATSKIPVVWAGNYSVGVNMLLHLTELTARTIGDRYAPEVTEIHHRHKKDAPSGTALNLAEALQAAPAYAQASLVHGREGETGARPVAEIGMHALRGGEVIGEHTVFFFGEHDRLELTHRANDRRIFASGAFRAARWATGKPAGLYSMRDVLGFKA